METEKDELNEEKGTVTITKEKYLNDRLVILKKQQKKEIKSTFVKYILLFVILVFNLWVVFLQRRLLMIFV